MGAVRKIAVSVSEDLARDIDSAVESGRYQSINDVVEDALETWRGEQADLDTERLRRLYEEGLASGPSRPMPDDLAEQIIARGLARLAEQASKGE